MEEIKAPKKERKLLKAIANIGKILANELILGIGRKFIGKAINKVGNKRQGLIIIFALSCTFAQASIDSIPFPITGNKQRLGYQTTGNGLVYRGRATDTITKPSNYVDKNIKSYLLYDSISAVIYVWKQTYWSALTTGITIDTTSLSNRINLKLNLSDTATMLLPYARKSYVDSIAQNFQDSIDEITNGYFKQEFLAVTKDTLNWTKSVQLVVGNSNLLLVYRNGQMINDAQYTVIDTNKVKIASTSYKIGENYTVVYVKGGGGSGGGGSSFDTTILNLQARLDTKLNLSDTASMLANYATKAYADTTGRFYARQEFRNVSSSTLTWTQTDTLVVNDTTSLQVYRNGQILMPNQYTVPTKTSVVISASSYKAGENYTVIFPRGGGAGSGGGSGSLTSISAGTGITVNPNPITTTGTVSADLSVLMELTDTSLLNLTSRFASKLNTTDTASLSNRINAKGNGTVTNVGNGYGILSTQSPITTSGVLRVDSNTVYNYVRDSIVKVRIGNDTIKILKQEYNNVTTDTLTWTTTNKFPIQLRAFILLFRNGQLLINDQYSVIDTNKVKVAATSYKIGENYTLVTVSGIGSAGVSQTGNPVYPEAGIALSTGTTWTSSIPNNSTNWNTAFTDRLKWDGGSTGLTASTGRTSLGGTTIGQSMFTLTNPSAITFPQFNAENTITALSASSFRGAIGAGTVTSVTIAAGTPLSISNTTTTPQISMSVATGSINGYLSSTDWTTFNNKQNALGYTPVNNTININTTSPLQGGGNLTSDRTLSILQASSSVNGFLSSTDWTTFNNKFNFSDTSLLNLTSRFAAKQNNITLTTTGTSGAATLIGSTLNIPQYTGGGGTVTSVSGTGAISVATGTTTPVISIADASTSSSGVVNTGTQSFIGSKTFYSNSEFLSYVQFRGYNYTATRLAGLSTSDRFATVGIGTGLSLSSGTLSATNTGTVTNVTGTLPISVATGTTTPAISIANASASASGVVNTTTQSFAGNKTFTGTLDVSSTGTFGGRVNTPWIERTYTNTNATSLTVSVNTTWLNIHQDNAVTLTLPSASTYPGKEIIIKQTGSGIVSSASSNIIGFTTAYTGATQTVIINPSGFRFVTLVSDGLNWIIMQRNN